MPRFTSRSWGSKCGICSQPGHTKPWCTSLNPQAQVIVCVSTLHKFPAEWHCEACRGDTLVHQEACHSDGPRKCHEEEVKSPSEREQKSAIGNECSEIPDASKKIGSPSGKPAARLLSRDFVPARCTKVGLPLVQQYLFQFEQLVREHLPKVGEHFSQEMINPSMYASQWFITVFSYSFPFNLALRIWDVFLYEGVQIVFQVGLALLKYCHDNLIKLPFEKLIHALRNFPDEAMDPDILLPMAYSIKVSKRLEELKKEYEKKNGKAVQPAGSSKEQLQDVKQK